MGILPLIDLLVLAGSCTLLVGFVLKAIDIATRYKAAILGFSSVDFLLMTGVFWLFALVLAARAWVKLNEPKLLQLRREQLAGEARRRAQHLSYALDHNEANTEGQAPREVATEER